MAWLCTDEGCSITQRSRHHDQIGYADQPTRGNLTEAARSPDNRDENEEERLYAACGDLTKTVLSDLLKNAFRFLMKAARSPDDRDGGAPERNRLSP